MRSIFPNPKDDSHFVQRRDEKNEMMIQESTTRAEEKQMKDNWLKEQRRVSQIVKSEQKITIPFLNANARSQFSYVVFPCNRADKTERLFDWGVIVRGRH